MNDYPENHIEEEFNELVDDWRESSKFVENKHSIDDVKIFCHKQSEKGNDRFFILAVKEIAIKIVEDSIESLKREGFFMENYYKYHIFEDGEDKTKRVEARLETALFSI